MSGSSPSSASVRNNTRETREARAFAQLDVLLFRVVSSAMISHGQVKYSIVSVSLVFEGGREGKGANNWYHQPSSSKHGAQRGQTPKQNFNLARGDFWSVHTTVVPHDGESPFPPCVWYLPLWYFSCRWRGTLSRTLSSPCVRHTRAAG